MKQIGEINTKPIFYKLDPVKNNIEFIGDNKNIETIMKNYK
jgi:hypothetical protein